jgi:hypothetical protein
MQEMITKVLDGFSSSVIAYGSTGTGKTYTVNGGEGDPGLIPWVIQDIFDQIETRQDENPTLKITLHSSFIELYQEKIFDLLSGNPEWFKQGLKVKLSDVNTYSLENLTSIECFTRDEMREIYE